MAKQKAARAASHGTVGMGATAALLLHLTVSAVSAAGTPAPAEIDLSKLPEQAKLLDQVIAPVPTEVFAVLDRLGKPNWAGVKRKVDDSVRPRGEAPQVALVLGTVIAEGFIAVESEDEAAVKKIGARILTLAEALGVRKAVVRRSNSIVEAADQRAWRRVRSELDGALTDAREAMIELNSKPLSHLVSLGGWLRGTEALSQVVAGDYSKDGADLFNQPIMLDYFEANLKSMRGRFASHSLTRRALALVGELRPLMIPADGSRPSAKTVKQIGALTGEFVQSIHSNP